MINTVEKWIEISNDTGMINNNGIIILWKENGKIISNIVISSTRVEKMISYTPDIIFAVEIPKQLKSHKRINKHQNGTVGKEIIIKKEKKAYSN